MTKKIYRTNQIVVAIISIIAGLMFAILFREQIALLLKSPLRESSFFLYILWPALFILGGVFGILAFSLDKIFLSVFQVAIYVIVFCFEKEFRLNDQYWQIGRSFFSIILGGEALLFLILYDLLVRRKIKTKSLDSDEKS